MVGNLITVLGTVLFPSLNYQLYEIHSHKNDHKLGASLVKLIAVYKHQRPKVLLDQWLILENHWFRLSSLLYSHK